jgi:hypothetical protein
MRKVSLAVSLVVGLSLLARAAAAQTKQWRFGPEVTFATNNLGLGAGARAVFSGLGSAVKVPGLEAYGALDFFFAPNVFSSIWEINLNGTWDIPNMTGGFRPYVGAGFNYAHYSVPSGFLGSLGASESGLNILGGTHFRPSPKLNMFGEVRIELRTASAAAFTVGILF